MPACGTTNPKIAPAGRRWIRPAVAAALLAVGMVRFLPLLRGKVLLAALTPLCDQWHVNMPFAFILSEALRAGHLPIWTDRLGGGYPLLALGEAGVLYPPHLLLYRLLPPVLAYNVNVILAVLTAAVCMYLLCRDLGRSRAASLLAGIAYSWSGTFLLRVVTLHGAQAASWAPLLLLCVRRGVRAGRPAACVPAGVVLALQITTGYPQMVYYSLVAAALFGLWEMARVVRPPQAPPTVGGDENDEYGQVCGVRPPQAPPTVGGDGGAAPRVRQLLRTATGALLFLAVAAGLSAVHWLPGLELTRHSGRSGGITFEWATQFGFPPVNLLTFIAPYAFGNPATGGQAAFSDRGHFWDNGYVGLVPLALALLGAAWGLRREGRVRFFSILLLLSLLVALGRHTPFFRLLWDALPGMSYFRFPSRFMAVADLSLAVLAAYGLDSLRARLRGRTDVLVGLVLAATLLDLWVYAARFQRFADAAAWLAPPRTARYLGDGTTGLRAPEQAPGSPQSAIRYYVFGYADFHQRAIERARGWMGDLTPYLEAKEVLAPNSGAFYGLSCFNVFGGLDLRRAQAVYALLADDRVTAGKGARVPRRFGRILAVLGVTHVVTPYALPLPGLHEVASVAVAEGRQRVRVYAVEGARPRVWIPDAVRPATDEREALAGLRDARAVAIEGAGAGVASAGGEVLSVEAAAGCTRARVRMRGPGIVMHNQRSYPGWSALVDGRPAPLYRASVLMQAAPVPAGEHTVEFRFESPSYVVGRAISLATAVLLVAAILASRLRRYSTTRRRARPNAQAVGSATE